MRHWAAYTAAVSLVTLVTLSVAGDFASHPPLREAPPPSQRPLGSGPVRYVDASRGDDGSDGSEGAPWKTINHGMTRIAPGETLCLRGGVYYENVYCARRGREDAPITIRSYPGEQAVIDGGFREFCEDPSGAWTPFVRGAPGEFRSTRPYPNIRQAMGSFGDSMVGLNTYYHAMDLRTQNEQWLWEDWEKRSETDCAPLYCGPGLWYDRTSGFMHLRLAHTDVKGVPNYAGETDPRKLPMVIAPFRSVPLTLDRASHVRIMDLVIRGAGHDCIVLDYAEHVLLENLTIWCGSYGIRAARTGPLQIMRCGLYGNVPPWLARSDTSKRAYPGKPHRDITRLNTHSQLVIDNGREFSVFATPVNDSWEIAYCDFTDAHDGPYLGGVSVRFHHNIVDAAQDDGIYLSQMYPRHLYGRSGAEIHLYQNYFGRCLTALAFGGADTTRDRVYIYRNVFDLRDPVYRGRPSSRSPEPSLGPGKVMGDHGSPPWPEMSIYHNTFVVNQGGRFAAALLSATSAERPRKVFNNIVQSFTAITIPKLTTDDKAIVETDGGLFWSPGTDVVKAHLALEKARPNMPGAHEKVADPHFVKTERDPAVANDYQLKPSSPAVDAGAPIPPEWPDPLRAVDAGKPDIGALPLGVGPFEAGRGAGM